VKAAALQLRRTRCSPTREPQPRVTCPGQPAPRSTRRESAHPVTPSAFLSLFFVSSPHVLHAQKPREALWSHYLSIRGNASSKLPDAGSPPRRAAAPHGPQFRLPLLKEEEIRVTVVYMPHIQHRKFTNGSTTLPDHYCLSAYCISGPSRKPYPHDQDGASLLADLNFRPSPTSYPAPSPTTSSFLPSLQHPVT